MAVIPIGLRAKPARGRFWRALAEWLDALVAYPATHAVPEQELRRADDDIKRCRQLMFPVPQRKAQPVKATSRRRAKM